MLILYIINIIISLSLFLKLQYLLIKAETCRTKS